MFEKTNENLNIMWSTFFRYSIKGSIEVNTRVTRSIDDIISILQRPNIPFVMKSNVTFMLTLTIIYVMFILILIYVVFPLFCYCF